MADNKMIEKMAKLMQMSNAVTYEPNAHQIELSAQPTREKYYVTADDGHLTIDYTSLGTLLYNAGYRKQEWISVDDRLPEESGIYLAFSNLGNRLILDYSARHKLFNSFDSYSTEQAKGFAIAVTHWMPLPEPPETKGETE